MGRIVASQVRVFGVSDSSSNPLNAGALTDGSHSHLRLQNPWHSLLMRFRSEVISAVHGYLATHAEGPFHQVHHPVITHTDCEGGAEVFPVLTQKSKNDDAAQVDDFFGGRRFLTVTAAIHGEAFTMGLDRVWMLAPCFRAERSQDDRHLAEFHMLEISMNYSEELEPLMKLCEEFLRGLVERLRNSPAACEVLEVVGRRDTTRVSAAELRWRWELLTQSDWPRITHADAIRMMKEAEAVGNAKFQMRPRPETDLATEHEMFVLHHFQRPVFVTHYPSKIRLFSALQSPAPQSLTGIQTTESVDLLLPTIGEVFSGGLREHRLEKLIEVMREKGFFRSCGAKTGVTKGGEYPFLRDDESLDSLEWFADLRRWGTSPHGGFGIGFERLLKYLTGAESLRDVVAFPRYYKHCQA
ncbi:hypothetical protein M409DRAFT_22994 [Zasmidium cellare ATCC 36951]|uniref:Aminoacyl-transfer RNA synthetases class-II family profile domain-containing protein n=1 Tax=Zasmidium cellare ATCC 36951 TaxID=1080233 RepID=A0A6A6CIG8_ZASCE|nr:uncharacterized protein M409DRAFT_22994 [Zasmidium cellare ATCC 36951]KAF2166945.1 hypothetical protein M409DRAFT_22994 [Zasmidium cellare ATCC 36951]